MIRAATGRLASLPQICSSWRAGLAPCRGRRVLRTVLCAGSLVLALDGQLWGAAALLIFGWPGSALASAFDALRLARWDRSSTLAPAQGLALAQRALSDKTPRIGALEAARVWERSRFSPSEPVRWIQSDLLGYNRAWLPRSGTFLEMLEDLYGPSGVYRFEPDGVRILALCRSGLEEAEIFEACSAPSSATSREAPRL